MHNPFNWKSVQRFSIRKLTIGVVSASLGMTLLGLAPTGDQVQAEETNARITTEAVANLDYQYVHYEELTDTEKALLKPASQFPNEIADADATYLLVYRPDQGLNKTLPVTGDTARTLLTLLGSLSLAGVILAVKRRDNKLFYTLIIVSSLGAGSLTASQTQALETGLKTFLTQAHRAALGTQVPQPDQRIGDRYFSDYAVLKKTPISLDEVTSSEASGAGAMAGAGQVDGDNPVSPTSEETIAEVSPTAPVSEEPSAEVSPTAPVSEEPSTEVSPTAPASEEPSAEVSPTAPVSEEPSTEVLPTAPVSEEPSAEVSPTAPVSEEPSAEVSPTAPVSEEPSAEVSPTAPVSEEPSAEVSPTAPVSEEPSTEVSPTAPVSEEPSAEVLPTVPVGETVIETVTRVLEHGTSYQADPNLWEGEQVVAQAGQNGLMTFTITDGVSDEGVVTQEAVDEIILVGTKPIQTTQVVTEIVEIPYTEEVVYDDNLWEDDSQLTQEGVNGQTAVTKTYTVIREVVQENPVVTESVISPAIAQILSQGTKPVVGQVVEVTREVIPHEQVVTETADLWADERVTVQAGVDGEKEVTTTYETVRDVKQPNPTVEEVVVSPASPEVINQGTKPILGSEDLVETKEIPFEVVTKEDADRWEDEARETIQEGKNGLETTTTTYQTERGVRTSSILNQLTVLDLPIAQIDLVGTKPVEGTTEVVTEETIPFEVVIEFDPEKAVDSPDEIVQVGLEGLLTITEVYKTVRGEQVGDPISRDEKVGRAARNQIIKRGQVPVFDEVVEVAEVVIPHGEIVTEDANLWEDDHQVIRQGQDGLKEVTTTYVTINGVKQPNPSVTEVVLVEPVAAEIVQGTKPIKGSEEAIETKVLPFETEIEPDADLWEDTPVEILRAGQDGLETITTTYETIRGERTTTVLNQLRALELPITQLEKVGTKPIEGTVDVLTTETITTDEVIYQDDASLYVGEEEVVSESVPGEKTITTTYKTVRGEQTDEVVGEPVEVVTTAPQAKVVKRGTKVATEAEKQDPTAVKQAVLVNDLPEAVASIDPTSVDKVKTYTWKETPDTSSKGLVAATVIVTYEDDSVDEVAVEVEVIDNKTKPILTLVSLVEEDDDKFITLNYDLEDPTSAYVSAKYEIYDGDTLVKSGAISTWDDFDVTDLDWFVPYTLKTTLVYDLGDGQQSEVVSEDPFELEYKRVEIKHVDRVELYEKQADGSFALVEKLASNPSDYSNYYAKVIDDQQKDTYLSVIASEEADLEGKPYVRLTATAPQLIEYSGQGTENQDNYQFYIPKEMTYTDGLYRDFGELVAAMRANPAGTFELGDDLDASKFTLTSGATSYVPEAFTGKLIGHSNQIKNLTAPLFANLSGAFEVSDLALTNVNINMPNVAEVGALAKQANGTAGQNKISNVAVQGDIVAQRLAGGLVYLGNNTTFENISFDGNIRTTNNWNADITGGLVGYLRRSSTLDKGRVNANITVNAAQNPGAFHVGAITGSAGEGSGALTQISNVVATGNVTNTVDSAANIGGLVGSTAGRARLTNLVSSVNVTNGEALVGKVANADAAAKDSVVVDGTNTGRTTDQETVSADQAQAKVDAMGITVNLADYIKPDVNQYDVDYSLVAGYQAANELKYANTEKLLPFYNKEFIVKQGNLISGGKLATTAVVSVVPMANDQVVSDYAGQKAAINQLMVYYADGSVDYMSLAYKEDFRDTAISEYVIDGGDLLFTPNQLTTNYQDVVARVQAELAGLDYYDANILTKLKKEVGSETVKDLMDKLYLNDSFEQVKAELPTFLNSVLATSNIIATPNHDLGQYIIDNKEELMMGLAYVNRWYNIQFGDTNLKDLFLYHQDFYTGQSVDTLDWLVSLGKGGYDVINPTNNISTFANYIGVNTGHNDLLSFLTANRETFTDYATDAEWFKATTKAYVVETPSKERPDLDVSAYSYLSLPAQQNGILPLLTTRGETFILTNMGGITYGMYDRYYVFNEIKALATQEEKEAYIENMAKDAAQWQADHFDFWYRMLPEGVREKIIKPMVTWDGYQIPNGGPWLPMYGDDSTDSIRDFFGPIGSRAHFANNGAGAIANGTTIFFMFNQVLTYYGSSVYSHEAVHNNDGSIYFDAYGRRFGLRAELFAQGLLQTPTSHAQTNFGINSMYDYAAMGVATADSTDRVHAMSPDRYQTPEDLHEYFHGAFDVLYTLDYAEANVALSRLTKEQQAAYFTKIENYYEVTDVGTGQLTHAGNTIRRFTADEWTAANPTTVFDLIDLDAMTFREHGLNQDVNESVLRRNGYYYATMFSPNYAALSNSTGAPGDLMFRHIAFELLAEKGYHDGFVPYVSNQLAEEALKRGSVGTETWGGTRTVGNITDDIVLDVVFGGQYATWQEFKKDMFQQRINKLASLKPITITYNNQEITLSSYAEMEALLAEALQEDINRFALSDYNVNSSAYNNNSRVKEVKQKIFNAYLRDTDDFRTSIYN